MSTFSEETVEAVLLRNIPRELILSIEEAFHIGAARAYAAARGMNKGHQPSVVGQMRHFHMNETFFEALQGADANPSPIRGNSIIVGRTGVFTLGRFNTSGGVWNNGRRSKARRELAHANRVLETLVQASLFDADNNQAISEGTVFFVASFSGSLNVSPDTPQFIDIAVPDKEMKDWLFREPIPLFLKRYDAINEQEDLAKPKLKKNIKKPKDGTNEEGN